LAAAQKTKKSNSVPPRNENNRADVQQQVSCRRVRVVTAAVADERDRSTLRREQLADDDLGMLLHEVEAGQRPEWRDISERSPVYKRYWAEWKSLAVRNGVLKRHWDSAYGKIRTAQIVIPRSKVREVLAEIHEGTSGGHLGFKKTGCT
jgi:hypothetical protein